MVLSVLVLTLNLNHMYLPLLLTVYCIDLIAIHYLYSMPRGYRSRHGDTHEIMTSVSVSGFGVSRLATPNITLNYVLEILCVWIDVILSSWRVVLEEKSCTGRGLGSGTVHIAGAVKHWFVRLAWLVSHNRRPEAFWGFCFNNWSSRPLPRLLHALL